MAAGVSGPRWPTTHEPHVGGPIRSRFPRGNDGGGVPESEDKEGAVLGEERKSAKGGQGASTDPTGQAGSRLDAFA